MRKTTWFTALLCFILSLSMAGCVTQNAAEDTEGRTSSATMEAEDNMLLITYVTMTEEEAGQMSPNAYNLDMAKEKNLATSTIYDKNYLEVQAAYRALLNYYLCETAGLDTYQEFLNNCQYRYLESEPNVYQKAGAFGRANIYIRNNVYVERLSHENLALLLDGMHDGSVEASDELLKMVKETMQEVISVRYDESGNEHEVIYDIGAFQMNSAPNNALVFAISYEMEYNEDGNIISVEVENEKLAYLKDLAMLIEREMSEKLGIKVCVFY